MLDKLLSDPLFILLSVAFCVQLFILLASSNSSKKRGLEWLYQDRTRGAETRQKWLKPVKYAIRTAFSANEEEMKKKFISSGYYNNRFAIYYMPFKYLLLAVGVMVLYWLSEFLHWTLTKTIVWCLLWVVAAVILPDTYLATRARQLKVRVTHKLPYMIDLLAVCIQTGMTIESSMDYLSKEMNEFDPDLGYLLNKTRDRTKVAGLERALDEMYERVPTNEMRSFVMTLKQSIQYGSSIYDVLTTLSSEIRAVQMLTIEEKVGKLAAKMSVPLILFIMFPIVVLIAAPGIMRIMN